MNETGHQNSWITRCDGSFGDTVQTRKRIERTGEILRGTPRPERHAPNSGGPFHRVEPTESVLGRFPRTVAYFNGLPCQQTRGTLPTRRMNPMSRSTDVAG
jgi:hypothetical protein